MAHTDMNESFFLDMWTIADSIIYSVSDIKFRS